MFALLPQIHNLVHCYYLRILLSDALLGTQISRIQVGGLCGSKAIWLIYPLGQFLKTNHAKSFIPIYSGTYPLVN